MTDSDLSRLCKKGIDNLGMIFHCGISNMHIEFMN